MSFFRVWLVGYYSPAKFAEGMKGKPAPHWGLCAQILRAALLALVTYLPLHLMGRVPPTPSHLSFVPTARYYGALVWIAPLVLLAQWVLCGGVAHVVLRLLGRPSDVDVILNIGGMTALVVGAFLILWDWAWIGIGGMDQISLGISHLVLDLWGALLTAVALKRILGVPTWLGVLLYVLTVAAALPLAIMFMRSPL